jgi:hypothetical protein
MRRRSALTLTSCCGEGAAPCSEALVKMKTHCAACELFSIELGHLRRKGLAYAH